MGVRMAAIAAAVAMTWASGLSAQQPGGHGDHGRHGSRHGGQDHAAMMERHAREMDSLDSRLDSLVQRMNASTGNARTGAMAAVITELVSQRRAMHAHHREMMREHLRREADSTGHP